MHPYITNRDNNNVTIFKDEGNNPNAQKCVEHEQKEKEPKITDSGDVTLAYDDEQNEAHKAVSSNKEQSKTGIRNSINENKEEDDDKSLKTSDKDVKKKHKMKDLDSDDVTPANRDAEDEIIAPTKIPDDEQKRQMFSKSVEIMILAGMENHVYTFGNEIKKQKEGGPIGLSLTGEIADCYLIQWDKKFQDKLRSFGINLILYQRFKDDITIVTEELDKGSKLENGRIIIDENKRTMDIDKHGDEITMEIIVEIAESVDDIVKFTADMPSKHKSNKIAILDVEVNINKKEQNRIDYEFYEKPTQK